MARAPGFDTVSSATCAPEATAKWSMRLRAAAALEAVARGGLAPPVLLVGHPACPASTSRSGGSPKSAERSRKAPPTTSVSQVGRVALAPVRSLTPSTVRTIRISGIRVGPSRVRIWRNTARCAADPPTIVVDVAALAAAATATHPRATSTTSPRTRIRRVYASRTAPRRSRVRWVLTGWLGGVSKRS